MDRPLAPPARLLFSDFAHDRGPAVAHRTIATGVLQEWPELWRTDSRFRPSLREDSWEAALRSAPDRLRFFSVPDPEYPQVPLLPVGATDLALPEPSEPLDRWSPADTGIRDKFWQRLVVERIGHLSQPGFAVVNGNRIEA